MARQKNVYRTSEIAHLWYHQTQSSARNSQNNFFFSGDTIYSYGHHFEIARQVANELGHMAVIFNSASDSSTTAQHKTNVLRAIPGNATVISYPAGRRQRLTLESCLKSNQAEFLADLNNLRQAVSKPSKAKNYSALLRSREALVQTSTFMGVEKDSIALVFTDIEEGQYKEILRDHTEKVSVKREAKYRQRQIEHERWIAEREADSKLTEAERIESWRNGKHTNLPYHIPTMLRIQGVNVETSKGVSFPLSHAIKRLPLVMAVINRELKYERGEGDTVVRLGHYSIDSIGDGVVKAGCHVITYNEVRHFAELANQQQSIK